MLIPGSCLFYFFIFILFRKNILLLLLYPRHVIKLVGHNLGCYIIDMNNHNFNPSSLNSLILHNLRINQLLGVPSYFGPDRSLGSSYIRWLFLFIMGKDNNL